MDKELLELIVCPECKSELVYDSKKKTLNCHLDNLAFPIRDGIPIMLIEEAEPIAGDDDHE